MEILLIISIIGLITTGYILIRNQWVYDKRIEALKNDVNEYNKLPTYEKMLFKYPFCWDIEKLKEKNK